MKFYGVKIAEGAEIQNLVVEVGGSFPTGPDRPPNLGEMFFKTGSGEGLYVYNGASWDAIGALTLDPELEALASVTSAADTLPYFTGSATATVTSFTSFGRQLVDDANQTEAHATLGLGTAATANTGTSGNTVPFLDGVNTWTTSQTFSGALIYGGITQAVVQPATVNGRFSRWNSTNSRYEQFDLFGTANTWTGDQNFSGIPTAPTAAPSTNTTQIATTAFVQNAVAASSGAFILQEVSGTSQSMSVNTHYVFTNTSSQTTATLPASPTAGDTLIVSNFTGRTDLLINRNGSNIMQISDNLTIDAEKTTISMKYVNATIGWIII